MCPARTTLKNGKCVSTGGQSTVPLGTPEIKSCPKGWSRVRGKCIAPKPLTIVCQKGWTKVNGKCIPPKTLVKPCPRGWSRKNGKCYPPKPQATPQINKPLILKPTIKLKPQTMRKPTLKKLPNKVATPTQNTGKVMMLAPSHKLR